MSWGRPRTDVGVSPQSSTSGVRPRWAVTSAVSAFVIPGPCVTVATPTRPEARAKPSAAATAPDSWRVPQ